MNLPKGVVWAEPGSSSSLLCHPQQVDFVLQAARGFLLRWHHILAADKTRRTNRPTAWLSLPLFIRRKKTKNPNIINTFLNLQLEFIGQNWPRGRPEQQRRLWGWRLSRRALTALVNQPLTTREGAWHTVEYSAVLKQWVSEESQVTYGMLMPHR